MRSGCKRNRILDDQEIKAVWDACEGTFGDIVKMLLLTGQRLEEVGGMRWSDLNDGVWSIPHEARAKGVPEMLRLPQAALDILNARDRLAGNPFVFPGRATGKPFNSYSQGKAELDAKLNLSTPDKLPQWQLHDLRRTAGSLMSRAGVTPHTAEGVLGHTIKGVEGIYDRHKYADETAYALEALAALVGRIVNPPKGGTVVDFAEAKRA
jgi:integrase